MEGIHLFGNWKLANKRIPELKAMLTSAMFLQSTTVLSEKKICYVSVSVHRVFHRINATLTLERKNHWDKEMHLN